jgi:4,5-DOPA dioxygenase extradiol
VTRSPTVHRRAVLGAAAGLALGSAREARGASADPPVLYVSHGSPLLLPGNEARRAELQSWGARLPRPRAVLVMTPHYGVRHLELGHAGRGHAMYDLPGPIARRLPRGLEYATPPSEDLARRVEGLLGGPPAVSRGDRSGFDHTTWMPLSCLFPSADVPTLELAFPYLRDAELFALGQRLAPLRDEGVLFVASGQVTHNLAMFDPVGAVPAWATEFDAWTADRLAAENVDALVDWRNKAPAVDLAHPDDGGHYRVLLVALGVALGSARPARNVTFPVTGFEATMSRRCVEMGE